MDQALIRQPSRRVAAQVLLGLGLLGLGSAVVAQGTLTLDMGQPGHWLDLAEQARQQGQNDAALEFLDTLQERHAPLPAGIARYVQDLREHLRQSMAQAQPTRNMHTAVAIGLAHDSNINAGLSQDNLTLTLPQGSVQLPVAPASQARSAYSARLQILHQRELQWGDTPWNWLMHAQARGLSPEAMATQQDLGNQLQTPMSIGPLKGQIGLGWSQHWRENQNQTDIKSIQWRTAPNDTGCDTQSLVQTEWRTQTQARHLDTQWTGYRYSGHCTQGLWRYDHHLQAAYESAGHAERPGGDTRHLGWGMHLTRQAPLGLSGHILRIGISQLYSTDTRGYHPLLNNNQSRTQNRSDVQLHWSAPLSVDGPWRWNVQLQSTRQDSNLELFRIRNQFLEWSISRAW